MPAGPQAAKRGMAAVLMFVLLSIAPASAFSWGVPNEIPRTGFGLATTYDAPETAVAHGVIPGAGNPRKAELARRSAVWLRALAATSIVLTLALAAVASVALFLFRRESHARQDRVRADERAARMAYCDAMTGLPNALHFQDKLTGALSAKCAASILVADLDDFSAVNDRCGQAFGDAIIKELAWRMRTAAEENGGFATRLGGDRFGLYIPCEDEAVVAGFCADLLTRCAEPVAMGAQLVAPSVSVGVAVLSSLGHARTHGYESVLRAANLALHAAKQDLQRSVIVYDGSLDESYVDRTALAEALPGAMSNDEIEVYLQPQVDMTTGDIRGFEALARWWRHGVLVPAADMRAAARKTGLITDLDRFMLERAAKTVADWNCRRKTSFAISVNVSADHFQAAGVTSFVAECLSRHRMPAELVTLEITETAGLEYAGDVARAVEDLKASGCRFAIDDFGSGRSSLVDLRRLAVDEIKISLCLIDDLETCAETTFILDAVLDLARNLNKDVIVEGVERQSQADILIGMGCSRAQGDLYGCARPAADWLADVTYGRSVKETAA